VKYPHFVPQTKWQETPGIAPGTWQSLKVAAPQGDFELVSLPGVFSFDRLDPGTILLLDHLQITPGERVLDLGCGYGIIGLAAAGSGARKVDLVDANLLAVAAAQENLRTHGYNPKQALPSDVLSAVSHRKYDAIFSNPPFHTGREVNYQITNAFIGQSHAALTVGGHLTLVANQFIRYDKLLKQTFTGVTLLAEDGRYQVWKAQK
jgi:16S rRNA (guanine1207-N2)-methyltransferase